MKRDPVTQAVQRMLDETDTRVEFAVELARELGWSFQHNTPECVRRCRQYFNGQMYRHLPAAAIPVAIRVSVQDRVSPILRRVLTHAEDQHEEDEPKRPGMATVGAREGIRRAS